MILVGYCRVSSDSQADNTSLPEQRRKIEAYCQAFGHELVAVFTEVGSAKDSKARPEFQRALQTVRDGVDGIIATKLDRIARNTRDVLTLVEEVLQPLDKALVMIDLQVDTSSPTGRMILTIMAAVAQLERDVINERTSGGRKAKAEAGGYAHGAPKFGLKAFDGALVLDQEEQEIINLIARHHKSGKSTREIAKWLNTNGYRTKRGRDWQSAQVSNILRRKPGE